MRRNILNNLLVCSIVLIAFGCKAKKALVTRKVDSTAVTAPVDNAAAAKAAKLEAIKSRQLTYNSFSGKAKTKLNINGNSNDVTLNVRIQHNQKIWVSVTALLGIEVARAMITPDSIMVINRLQGVYMKKPFSYIYTYASKQLNFQSVEALLVGNPIPQLLKPDGTLEPAANGSLTLKGNLETLLYMLLIGPDMKVTQTTLSNARAAQSLKVLNSEFIQADNRIVPSNISITSAIQNKNIQIDLNYGKVEFDQVLDYSFSIPSKYSPAN